MAPLSLSSSRSTRPLSAAGRPRGPHRPPGGRLVSAASAAPSSSSPKRPSSSPSPPSKQKRPKPKSKAPTLEETATELPTTATASTPTPSPPPFDWLDTWYPVAYVEDLSETPSRVSLFDEPIALALKRKKSENKKDDVGFEVIALADRCSHRGAALSEGRVTAAGCLQCPYHGYTFDSSGACVAIPHAPGAAKREGEMAKTKREGETTKAEGSDKKRTSSSPRTSVRSYASAVSQGIVWLSPCSDRESSPPPVSAIPTIPELDSPGWVSDDFVRDFDGIDAQLLIANVADPDHGLFAHQTPTFDSFSASVKAPMRVSTREGRRRASADEKLSRRIVGRVEATPVLTSSAPSSPSSSVAELVFEPPCHVRWARMDPVAGEGAKSRSEDERGEKEGAKFVACFYATPLGLGRTRLFVRYARCVLPGVRVPRPVLAMGLNGFLDSDSQVVATQAHRVAVAEAAAAAERERDPAKDGKNSLSRSLYLFRSPTESFLSAVASWLDEALPLAPGRDAASLASLVARLEADSADGGGGLPRRERVLDRFSGHTSIVPSSMRFYRGAKGVEGVGKAVATVFGAAAVAVAAVGGGGETSLVPLVSTGALAALVSLVAADLSSRFEYRFTRERQAKELEKIAALAPEVERATSGERF